MLEKFSVYLDRVQDYNIYAIYPAYDFLYTLPDADIKKVKTFAIRNTTKNLEKNNYSLFVWDEIENKLWWPYPIKKLTAKEETALLRHINYPLIDELYIPEIKPYIYSCAYRDLDAY